MKKMKYSAAFLCCIMVLSACGAGNKERIAETTPTATVAAVGENETTTAETTAAHETEEKEPLYIPESGMAKAAFCDEMVAANSLSALSENYDSVVITLTGTEEDGENMFFKMVISEFEGKRATSVTCDFDDIRESVFTADNYAVDSILGPNSISPGISIIPPGYKGNIAEKLYINYFPEDAYLCDIREEEGIYVVEMGSDDSDDDARLYYYLNPEDFSLIKITGKSENAEAVVDFEYNTSTALDMTAYDAVFGGDDLVSVTFCFDPDTEEEYSCTLKLNKNTVVSVYAEELIQYFYKDKEMTEIVRDISELDGATIYANSEKTGVSVFEYPYINSGEP